jgi:hypothetical protein
MGMTSFKVHARLYVIFLVNQFRHLRFHQTHTSSHADWNMLEPGGRSIKHDNGKEIDQDCKCIAVQGLAFCKVLCVKGGVILFASGTCPNTGCK